MFEQFRSVALWRCLTCWVALGLLLIRIGDLGAAPVTIDFDSLQAGPSSAAGDAIPATAQLSNQFASFGVLFKSQSPFVAVVSLGSGTASPPNAIGGSTSDGLISYSVPIRLTFVSPDDPDVPAVTNFVSIHGDLSVAGSATNTILALDVKGKPIAFDLKIEPPAATLTISARGIHEVLIIGSGNTAFDDLTFNAVTPLPKSQGPKSKAALPWAPGGVVLSAVIGFSLFGWALLGFARHKRSPWGLDRCPTAKGVS